MNETLTVNSSVEGASAMVEKTRSTKRGVIPLVLLSSISAPYQRYQDI